MNTLLTVEDKQSAFYWNAPSMMLTIWYPGWCAYPLNSSYPICSRGGSGSRRDGRQKERDNWRQNKVQPQIRLRGRGELGWKHSEEQSEINLDTPDGLKLACERTCMCASHFLPACPFGLVCRYLRICVFSVSSEIQQHLVCTQWAGSDISLMEKIQKYTRTASQTFS